MKKELTNKTAKPVGSPERLAKQQTPQPGLTTPVLPGAGLVTTVRPSSQTSSGGTRLWAVQLLALPFSLTCPGTWNSMVLYLSSSFHLSGHGSWGNSCQWAEPESHPHTLAANQQVENHPNLRSSDLEQPRHTLSLSFLFVHSKKRKLRGDRVGFIPLFLHPKFLEEASRSLTTLSLIFTLRLESHPPNGV